MQKRYCGGLELPQVEHGGEASAFPLGGGALAAVSVSEGGANENGGASGRERRAGGLDAPAPGSFVGSRSAAAGAVEGRSIFGIPAGGVGGTTRPLSFALRRRPQS